MSTFSEESLRGMGVYSLLELRERLRDLLNDVNDDVVTLLQTGDALALERDRLKRAVAAGQSLATVPRAQAAGTAAIGGVQSGYARPAGGGVAASAAPTRSVGPPASTPVRAAAAAAASPPPVATPVATSVSVSAAAPAPAPAPAAGIGGGGGARPASAGGVQIRLGGWLFGSKAPATVAAASAAPSPAAGGTPAAAVRA